MIEEISEFNSHTSNWLYRTNRPYFGNFEVDHMVGSQKGPPRPNLSFRPNLTAKICSKPTVAGSILTDGNFFSQEKRYESRDMIEEI